jgi:hypothetical protein
MATYCESFFSNGSISIETFAKHYNACPKKRVRFSEATGERALSFSNLSMGKTADFGVDRNGYGCLFFASEPGGTL